MGINVVLGSYLENSSCGMLGGRLLFFLGAPKLLHTWGIGGIHSVRSSEEPAMCTILMMFRDYQVALSKQKDGCE